MKNLKVCVFLGLNAVMLSACGGGGGGHAVIVPVVNTGCNPSYQCCDGVGDCGVIIVGSSSGTSVGTSTGSSSGGYIGSSTGSSSGSYGSSSGSYGSSSGSYGSSSGSYGSSSGSYGSSSGSYGSSSGSYGSSDGSSGGYYDGYKNGGNGSKVACATVEECAAEAQPFNQAVTDLSSIEGAGQASISDSIGGGTADVDQQQAQAAQQDQASRAQTLANSFQMDYGKALQLTQLSDQVKNMTANGQMTDEDRAAIMDKALGVAQISTAEVNAAAADAIKNGDGAAVNALVDKAATNLGMPSDQELKDKLLPALGLQF